MFLRRVIDDYILDRFRFSPAGVAWCFLMCIVCGEQIGTARLSDVAHYAFPSCLCSLSSGNLAIRSRLCFSPLMPLRLLACVLVSRAAASALFLFRLAFAIALSRHRWYSPRSSYRRAGRASGSSLLACCGWFGLSRLVSVVCSFFSYVSHRHLLGHERFPVVSSYLLRLVRAGHHSACGVVGHPRSSCVGMWDASACFVAIVPSYRPRPVPRAAMLLVSLLFVIRPVLRHGGRGRSSCGVRPRLARRSFSLLVVLVAGGVSAWRVIIMGCSRRWSVLCGLCGWSGCLPFLWYIGIVNWLYISFDWIFDMAGLPDAIVIGLECSMIDNAILIEIGGGELPILEPDKSIKYAGLAASRIADFVLEHDYRIPDYLKAAVFLDDGNPRLARAIRFVVDSLRVP